MIDGIQRFDYLLPRRPEEMLRRQKAGLNEWCKETAFSASVTKALGLAQHIASQVQSRNVAKYVRAQRFARNAVVTPCVPTDKPSRPWKQLRACYTAKRY